MAANLLTLTLGSALIDLALIALVLLGHTRKTGLRKRTVQKAAKWLQSAAKDAVVARTAARLRPRTRRGEAAPAPPHVMTGMRLRARSPGGCTIWAFPQVRVN